MEVNGSQSKLTHRTGNRVTRRVPLASVPARQCRFVTATRVVDLPIGSRHWRPKAAASGTRRRMLRRFSFGFRDASQHASHTQRPAYFNLTN